MVLQRGKKQAQESGKVYLALEVIFMLRIEGQEWDWQGERNTARQRECPTVKGLEKSVGPSRKKVVCPENNKEGKRSIREG